MQIHNGNYLLITQAMMSLCIFVSLIYTRGTLKTVVNMAAKGRFTIKTTYAKTQRKEPNGLYRKLPVVLIRKVGKTLNYLKQDK